tara:strand:+ start:54 stop:314 length:261 start_codon:yes stop_codon:yes gene_type:complete
MEKIIFFSLAIPILAFVFYLGASAIMKGFNAKTSKKDENIEDIQNTNSENDTVQLASEINKLNDLLKNKVLTKEEFEKAKKKILDK